MAGGWSVAVAVTGLAACVAASATELNMTLHIDAGYLVNDDGTKSWVGMTASALQTVVDASYPTISETEIQAISYFDASQLRYLDLSGGTYEADTTLSLPNLFVLRLDEYDDDTGFVLTASPSPSSDDYPSMVKMDNVQYSAVLGGFFDATANSTFEAIHITSGQSCCVRRVSASASAASVVHVQDGWGHEVGESTVACGSIASRGVWAVGASAAMVHANTVTQCAASGVDFDAGTTRSAVFRNSLVQSGQQGILLGETASNNFVYGNDAVNGSNAGIAVYARSTGPVTANAIAGNRVTDNAGVGITAGGAGGSTTTSQLNTFVGNVASGNGQGSFEIAVGGADAVLSDQWTSNVAGSGSPADVEWVGMDPGSSSASAVFEPDTNATSSAELGFVVRIDAGYLIHENGTKSWVGTTSSALQAVIDDMFPAVTAADIASASYVDASQLRYLDLSGGTYQADVTLYLPDMFVLRLEAYDAVTGLVLPANPTASVDYYPSMVRLDGVQYSAVLGGFFDTTANSTFEAIHIEDGSSCTVRRVNATGHAANVIQIRNGFLHQVTDSNIAGGDIAGRCLWLIATAYAQVLHNNIQHCEGHSLDMDAYTSKSTVFDNILVDNGVEGIFVEETASNNFVFGNNITGTDSTGIEVYSRDVGPVTENMLGLNTITNSGNHGLSSGGYKTNNMLAVGNVFIANSCYDNANGDYMIHHGDTIGDFWLANGPADAVWLDPDPENSTVAAVFQPELP